MAPGNGDRPSCVHKPASSRTLLSFTHLPFLLQHIQQLQFWIFVGETGLTFPHPAKLSTVALFPCPPLFLSPAHSRHYPWEKEVEGK